MFSIRMVLEFNGQVFNLSLNRIENGVIYVHLEDAGVQIHRAMQQSSVGDVAAALPEETEAPFPAEEAVQPPETVAHAAAAAPGGPEGEGVEPPPPPKKTAATRKQRQR
jgi:hypothetical protein